MALIVLEGLDGAGKSTQIKLLKRLMDERGARYEYLHFPRFDAPVYGDLIARFLRGEFGEVSEVNPYLAALLYAGDRAEAAAMIRGWLDDGRAVLLDRYVYSNVGYQCAKVDDLAKRDELMRWILNTEYVEFAIPKPDVSVFLDVPFEFTSANLTSQRVGNDREYLRGGERDIHEESLELQRRVREVYLEMAARDSALRVVDCSNGEGRIADAGVIFERIRPLVEPFI